MLVGRFRRRRCGRSGDDLVGLQAVGEQFLRQPLGRPPEPTDSGARRGHGRPDQEVARGEIVIRGAGSGGAAATRVAASAAALGTAAIPRLDLDQRIVPARRGPGAPHRSAAAPPTRRSGRRRRGPPRPPPRRRPAPPRRPAGCAGRSAARRQVADEGEHSSSKRSACTSRRASTALSASWLPGRASPRSEAAVLVAERSPCGALAHWSGRWRRSGHRSAGSAAGRTSRPPTRRPRRSARVPARGAPRG